MQLPVWLSKKESGLKHRRVLMMVGVQSEINSQISLCTGVLVFLLAHISGHEFSSRTIPPKFMSWTFIRCIKWIIKPTCPERLGNTTDLQNKLMFTSQQWKTKPTALVVSLSFIYFMMCNLVNFSMGISCSIMLTQLCYHCCLTNTRWRWWSSDTTWTALGRSETFRRRAGSEAATKIAVSSCSKDTFRYRLILCESILSTTDQIWLVPIEYRIQYPSLGALASQVVFCGCF